MHARLLAMGLLERWHQSILAKVNTITICVDEESLSTRRWFIILLEEKLPQFSLAQNKLSHEENPLALASISHIAKMILILGNCRNICWILPCISIIKGLLSID